MTFLLDVIVDFLARTAAWLAAEAVLAAAVAGLAAGILRLAGRPVRIRVLGAAALAGALIGASLAHRFDLPGPLLIDIWRHPLDVIWSLGGAAAAVAAWTLWTTRRRDTDG